MRGRTFGLAAAMLAVVLVATLAMVVAGCGGDEGDTGDEESQEPIKIGAILSLTGTYAGLGEPEKKPHRDGGQERSTTPAASTVVRSRSSSRTTPPTRPRRSPRRAELIEQDEVVAIIGATGTGQTMAMRGDVQRAGIPQVSMAGGTVITDRFDPLVFQTPWSNTHRRPLHARRHEEGRASPRSA